MMVLIRMGGLLEPVEKTLLDQKFRIFRQVPEQPRITLIMIDRQSLDKFSQNHGVYWPWPREVYGIVHNYLTAKQASLVVYDIFFDQPDFDRNGHPGSQSDAYFSQILGTHQNAVLAVQTNASPAPYSPGAEMQPFLLADACAMQSYDISNAPIPVFLGAAAGLGSVAIPSHNESLIRSVPLFFSVDEGYALPSLGMAAYLHYKQKQGVAIECTPRSVMMDSLAVPLQSDGKYLINWYGKGGVDDGTFPTLPFYSVFEAALQFQQQGYSRNDSLIQFQDNIVFIGANAAGLADIKSTPMSPLEPFPGVEIHATVTQNLLNADYVTLTPAWQQVLVLVLIIVCITTIVFWLPSQFNIMFSVLAAAGVLITGLAAFGLYRIWLPTAEFTLAALFTLTIAFIAKYLSEDAQKKEIRNAFSLYLQKELVEQIIDKPELLKLGGQKKELTVLFSDLAGFTTLSENTPPEELVTFLNQYLNEMTEIIFQHKGTLDKFIGDAIMAFWGAPVPEEDHAHLACACALQMEHKMKELQKRWQAANKPAPHVRYGINTGEMVVGNMGSDSRFNYTVVGDNVNLAARLEPANKDFGTQILISENTQKRVRSKLLTRQTALLSVKGKSKPIRVFELLCERDAPIAGTWLPFVEIYEKALAGYYSRNWMEAESLFGEALQLMPDDVLSQYYLQQSIHFKQNPPDTSWDGGYQQTQK